MDVLVYILFFFGTLFHYLSTKSIYSPQFIAVVLLFPVFLTSNFEVQEIFAIGIFFTGIGGFLYIHRSRPNNYHINIKYDKPVIYAMWLFIIIACLMSVYYFSQIGISIFTEDVGYERLVRRHAVSGSFLFQRMFRVLLPIMLLMYVYVKRDRIKNSKSTQVMFFSLFMLTVSFNVFTGMRGNIIIFVITPLVIFYGYLFKKIKLKTLALLFSTTFMFGLLSTNFMYPQYSTLDTIGLILERLSSSASDGIHYSVYNDVPNNGYYYGETYVNDILSIPYKLGIISHEHQVYGALLAQEMLGVNYNNEQAAVYTFGELYANFGHMGLAFVSLVIGFLLKWFHYYVVRNSYVSFRLPFLAYFAATLIPISGGPTLSMLLDYSVTVFLLFIFFVFTVKILRNFKIT